jgi:hypothetical protein
MTVCLDTNIVVQALAQQHSFHAIQDSWVAGQLSWHLNLRKRLAHCSSSIVSYSQSACRDKADGKEGEIDQDRNGQQDGLAGRPILM